MNAVTHAPPGTPNKYVRDFRTAPTLFSRLQEMIEDADAYVALRGGIRNGHRSRAGLGAPPGPVAATSHSSHLYTEGMGNGC